MVRCLQGASFRFFQDGVEGSKPKRSEFPFDAILRDCLAPEFIIKAKQQSFEDFEIENDCYFKVYSQKYG